MNRGSARKLSRLRRNGEMDQLGIAHVDGAVKKLEGLVEVSHFSAITQQGPDHGAATVLLCGIR